MKQLTDHAHELTQKWGREDRERERDAHDKSRLKHHGSNWAQAYRDFESLISAFQCGFCWVHGYALLVGDTLLCNVKEEIGLLPTYKTRVRKSLAMSTTC